jgi:UDP-glucose 4-epimerase
VRVLITGATGFVGSHLVPSLAGDHEILALVRKAPEPVLRNTQVIVADLSDPGFTRQLPDRVDVIVHLAQAYLGFPDHATEIFEVNTASTQRLAEWGRTHGVTRFILASSGSVYAPDTKLISETVPARPLTFHPATKLMAEQLLNFYEDSMQVARLRLFAPYGPDQTDRMIPRMIDSIREGKAIRLSRGGEPRLNPIHIHDLVRVLTAAVNGIGQGTINVAGPRAVTVAEIAKTVGAALGLAPQFEGHDVDPPGDLVADTTLMRRVFALDDLVDPKDGIRGVVAARLAHA